MFFLLEKNNVLSLCSKFYANLYVGYLYMFFFHTFALDVVVILLLSRLQNLCKVDIFSLILMSPSLFFLDFDIW